MSDNEAEYKAAVTTLLRHGYDLTSIYSQHQEKLSASEARQPCALDVQWATRLESMVPLQEHYVDQTPPLLEAGRCFKGRQYSLTPGQRRLLKQRHGLTPTRAVIVTDVALFAGSNVIQSFAIKSTLVLPDRRHVLDAAVVDPASAFFCEANRLDQNSETAKELERFVARIERLYLRAKVECSLLPQVGNSAGGVAMELQALCEVEKVIDQKQVREQLRCILIRRGEPELAAMVRNPRYFPDQEETTKQGKQAVSLAIAAEYI